MFKITYITHSNKIATVTHPNHTVCLTMVRALQAQGFKARFWAKDGSLIF